jgi:hypothetical protein
LKLRRVPTISVKTPPVRQHTRKLNMEEVRRIPPSDPQETAERPDVRLAAVECSIVKDGTMPRFRHDATPGCQRAFEHKRCCPSIPWRLSDES